MVINKGVNSLATVQEGDDYFDTRVGATAWKSVDETGKMAALITATEVFETLSWDGVAASGSQSLAFPRKGSYMDPRLGRMVGFEEPAGIKRRERAVLEMANHLLNNPDILDDTGSVDTLKVSSITLGDLSDPALIPAMVHRLIRPMLLNQGSSSWWRAN